MLLKSILCLILLSFIIAVDSNQNNPFESTIQSLGILTQITNQHTQNQIIQFITAYASQKCSVLTQINLVWQNSQIDSQIISRSSWVIPINIYATSQNSMNYKYLIPADSQANYYFTPNISKTVTCDYLSQNLLKLRQKMIVGLTPLVGQTMSYLKLNMFLNQMSYSKQVGVHHFNFVQNITFLPRHFIELSKSNAKQLLKMRNHLTPSCEEIYLNFVVSHFYPELRCAHMGVDNPVAIDNSIEVIEKTACIKNFIDSLGYFPVFYQRRQFNKKLWQNPSKSIVLTLKRGQIQRRLLNKNTRLLQANIQRQNMEERVEIRSYEINILIGLGFLILILGWIVYFLKRQIKLLEVQKKIVE